MLVSALALLLGIVGRGREARADGGLSVARPHDAPRLAIDEPKSGLHLEVDATCQRSETDGALGATCSVVQVEEEPGSLHGAAFIMGGGYSVDIVPQEHGTSPHLRASELCGALPSESPAVVTFGDRQFVRVRSPAADQLCFVTADEKPEITAILFRALDPGMLPLTHPEFVLDLGHEAEAVMATLRGAAPPPAAPASAGVRPHADFSSNPTVVVLILTGGVLLLLAFVKRASIAGLLGTERRRATHRAARSPAAGREQIAGSKCSVCKRKIVSERSAAACLDCKVNVHMDCLARHVSVSHGPSPGAYR